MKDLNYSEDFIFYLISLDKKTSLYNAILSDKIVEGDKSMIFTEKVIVKPEILIINLEIEDMF